MARDINKDLTNLLRDCYVWNKIAEESEEKRLMLIRDLAMLAGDLVCGWNGGKFGIGENAPGDKMFKCTVELADVSRNIIDNIREQQDETV